MRPVGRGYGREKMAEEDVFTGWRHLMCYLTHAGSTAAVKRRYRRRERREGKAGIRREDHAA